MPYTILRTAAGSPVAPSVLQALRDIPETRLVAVDSDPQACGFHFADTARIVPRVDDPAFLPTMLAVCQDEGVDLLFPDLDEELSILAEARADFEAVGTQVLVSPAEAIQECFDKHRTYTFFREHDILTPVTYLPDDLPGDPTWPLIVKPRSGRGSRGVFKMTSAAEVSFFTRFVDRPLIQEFVEGIEYTVDALSDLDGRFLYCSVRERLATDSGISVKGRTRRHPVVEANVAKIVEALGLVGPSCVQCIEDAAGDVFFIEVNPRIAGSAALSIAAGAPIASDAVRLARGEPVAGLGDFRPGTVMLRYWEAVYS